MAVLMVKFNIYAMVLVLNVVIYNSQRLKIDIYMFLSKSQTYVCTCQLPTSPACDGLINIG